MALTGKGLADFAKSKLGMPYFYGSKISNGVLTESYMSMMHKYYPNTVTNAYMDKARKKKQVGKVNVDCSGLIAGYRGKNVGSSQLYSTAKKRMPISQVKDFAVGTVLWKKGHVGVYIGTENGVPMCVEAKGIDYGVVKTKVSSTKWVYGLTFSDLTYSYDKNLSDSSTSKKKNPYTEPTKDIKYGDKGVGVKWVQWELVESGYKIAIDGEFGKATKTALVSFQKSCKITADGICGSVTRKNLKAK